MDQHILICVKSTDSDESYGSAPTCTPSRLRPSPPSSACRSHDRFVLEGEGCVALRAAQLCYMEFAIELTHQGEIMGTMTGGIQLRTSEGKPTEKLYGESGGLLGACRTLSHRYTDTLFLQISSRLKRMTLLTQKAKAATSTSKDIILMMV